jgi:RNA polymerase sigma factor for flagellar operon FliA
MSAKTGSSGALGEMPADVLRARANEAYAQQSRQALEEKLILDHLPLVRHIVQKVAGHLAGKVELEDLVSAGTVGLVKAARAYNPNMDAEFKTYAYIRIRGAVIDELRGRSFVPPAVHNQIHRAGEAYVRFATQKGRPPGDEELAAELGVSVGQLYRTLEEARKQHFLSIHGLTEDAPSLGSFIPADGGPSPVAEAERKELLTRLAEAIRELPERDRLILLLYYERDLTMKETAAVLEITESRVSQVHASALFKLGMKLRSEL